MVRSRSARNERVRDERDPDSPVPYLPPPEDDGAAAEQRLKECPALLHTLAS
jgi:hypothetical protein